MPTASRLIALLSQLSDCSIVSPSNGQYLQFDVASGKWKNTTVGAGLLAQNNLSDLQSVSTARTNLGLGSAATHASTDFAPATGIAESAVTNLVSDLAAKLPLAGGTMTGTIDMGGQSIINGTIFATDEVDTDLITTNTLNAPLEIDAHLNMAGRSIRLNTGAGTGGGNILMDGGNISGAGTVTATTFSGSGASLTTIPESAVTNLTTDLAAKLVAANNLSDVANAGTARTNLGLGTAATHPSTDFAPSSGIAESAVTNLTTDLAAKLPLAGGTMTGNIVMGSHAITGATTIQATGITSTGSSLSLQTNTGSNAGAVNFNANSLNACGAITISANAGITMASGNISGASTISATTFSGSGASLTSIPQSAVTNLTTDLAAKLPLAGGTMSGNIAMGGNNISNVGSIVVTGTVNSEIAMAGGDIDMNDGSGTGGGTLHIDGGIIYMGTGGGAGGGLFGLDSGSIIFDGVAQMYGDGSGNVTLATTSLLVGGDLYMNSGAINTQSFPVNLSGGVLSFDSYSQMQSDGSGNVTFIGNQLIMGNTAELQMSTGSIAFDLSSFMYGDGSGNVLLSGSSLTLAADVTQKLGFYGHTPVVQPTGSIITTMALLGLNPSGTIDIGEVSNLTNQLNSKAPLSAPTFTAQVNIADAANIAVGTTTGTKIGGATNQKIGLWNTTPVVQPTTGVASSTIVANSGTTVNQATTYDGYTIQQVVKALRTIGILA